MKIKSAVSGGASAASQGDGGGACAWMKEYGMRDFSPGMRVVVILLAALAYGVAAKLSFLITIPPGNISPVFPPAGIALAAVLLWGRGVLPGVWAGSFVMNLISFSGGTLEGALAPKALVAGACIGLGAAGGAWLGAACVRRFCPDGGPLSGARQVGCLLLFGALVGCLVSPTVGVASLTLAGYIRPPDASFAWLTWWIGDTIGAVVAAPLLLAWSDSGAGRLRWKTTLALEVLGLAGTTGAMVYFAFFRHVPVDYLALPLLGWAALRFGMRGVTSVALVITCAAAVGTSMGVSVMSGAVGMSPLLLLYSYLGAIMVFAFIFAGLLEERRLHAEGLRASEERFKIAVGSANVGVWDWDVVNNRLFWDESMFKLYGIRREDFGSAYDAWLKCVHPDDAARANAGIADALAGKREWGDEFRIRRPDGTVRHILSGATTFRDASGRALRMVGANIDITERKVAERSVHESEARYRRLIDTANEGILLLDRGKIRFVNPRMGEMLGRAVGDFVGKSPEDFLFEEDRNDFREKSDACISGASQSFERRFLHAAGHPVWTHASVSPVHDDTGAVVGAFGMFADITERKKSESRDRHIRHILELVASGKPLPEILEVVCRSVQKDLPGALSSVLLFDSATNRLRHGAAPDLPEFYQKAVDGIVAVHGAGSCGSAAADAVPVIVEDILTHPYWVAFKDVATRAGLRACWSMPILTSSGAVVATFAIYHREPYAPTAADMEAVRVFVESIRIAVESERSREEVRLHREHLEELVRERTGKLQESERLQLAILDNVDACIYLKDTQGRYLFANRPIREMWNVRLEDIVGRDDSRFFDAATAEAVRVNDRRVLKEGLVLRADETNTVSGTGLTRTFQSTKIPLRREDGTIYALCGISTDITARKAMEAELIRSRDAAEAANRAKSVFLSNMSHELRTPLNAILGYAQMMLRDRPADHPDAEALRIVNKSGEHLLGLINSVLDLTKIETHKHTLEPEDFDLGDFVRGIVDMLRRRAEDKGISLSVDQTSSFPRFIRADRNKLRQVLLNIVGNAVKFTDTGGVSLRLFGGGPMGEDGTGRIVFSVADTGPGILPEDAEKIFRPFEQASGKHKGEGTGLGLTLAREFVRLMGGDVSVSAAPGGGSVFTFDIRYVPVGPAAVEKAGASKSGGIVAVEGAAGVRVLIVEDQLENRILLKKLLTKFGFTVAEAANGEIGVRMASEWKPDMIFMDRRMPVMDGLVATKQIRGLPGGEKFRIAAVTAEAFKEDFEIMMAAGCDAFIRKPYGVDEILECLGALPGVKLVRAAPAHVEAVSVPDAKEIARAEFAKLPGDVVKALRVACAEVDSEKISRLLTPHPEAAAAAKPFLEGFRTDVIDALLPATSQ